MSIELNILHTDGTKQFLRFKNTQVRVGRNPDCEIAFEDAGNESVSWDHAIISMEDEPKVVDQNASNGTFLNGQRFKGALRITEGDSIRLGGQGPVVEVVSISRSNVRDSGTQDSGVQGSVGVGDSKIVYVCGAGGLLLVLGLLSFFLFGGGAEGGSTDKESTALVDTLPTDERARRAVDTDVSLVEKPVDRNDQASTNDLAAASEQKPTVVSPAKPKLTSDDVLKKFGKTIVWAAMKMQSKGKLESEETLTSTIPWCTGWIYRSGQVFVVADRAQDFKKIRTQTQGEVVVSDPNVAGKFYDVGSIDVHSKFNADAPTSSVSLLHNVGSLSVTELSATRFQRADPDGLIGRNVYVCGYFSIPDGPPVAYSRLSAPKLSVQSGRLTAARSCTNCNDLIPLAKLEFRSTDDSKPRYDGMLVVDEYGDVVGLLTTLSDGVFVVSVENVVARNSSEGM